MVAHLLMPYMKSMRVLGVNCCFDMYDTMGSCGLIPEKFEVKQLLVKNGCAPFDVRKKTIIDAYFL